MGTRGSPPDRSRQGSRLAGLTRAAATRPIGGITNKAQRRHSKPNHRPRFRRHGSSLPGHILPSPSQSNWPCEKCGLTQPAFKTTGLRVLSLGEYGGSRERESIRSGAFNANGPDAYEAPGPFKIISRGYIRRAIRSQASLTTIPD